MQWVFNLLHPEQATFYIPARGRTRRAISAEVADLANTVVDPEPPRQVLHRGQLRVARGARATTRLPRLHAYMNRMLDDLAYCCKCCNIKIREIQISRVSGARLIFSLMNAARKSGK